MEGKEERDRERGEWKGHFKGKWRVGREGR